MSEETTSDFVELSGPVHPNQQIILVKNEAAELREWTAGGKLISMKPGDVKRYPRWVYQLALRYPGYGHSDANPGIRELNPNEGSKEWERAQLASKQADLVRRQEALKREQEEIAALEADIDAKAPKTSKDGKNK